ncbi:PREDICTED: cytochrome c oxidase subunit 8B, mitochondrial [Ceratotherium simum simum]|uniref:Cytochrome c oxidase subunit 8 n=1 Tax=Ceratotherium simum simum TaxID=73337 RepID=A0ABM1DHE9_CERSS|nr:PREDICTED: cytochrome c oxidase subunit 8B, mitochondrial [Ceratotherium simum simum]
MLRLAPTVRLLQAPLRGWVVPKAHVSAKPARTPTSPAEQAIGLSVTFLSFLIPAGWVLYHLENYKRSSAE